MNFKYILLTIIAITLFSGCSSRSKGFFEDLYSATEVRSATSQDYADVKAPKNAPIIIDTEDKTTAKQNKNYSSDSSQIYNASGKIIDIDYDKDVNLYVYAFLKSGTANPISFYYDKNLKQYMNKIITVTVKDNFLIEYSASSVEPQQKRTKIKRRRSRIKVPIVEKINTL